MELDELERKVDSIIQEKDRLNSEEIMMMIEEVYLECFSIMTNKDEKTTDGLYSIKKVAELYLKLIRETYEKLESLDKDFVQLTWYRVALACLSKGVQAPLFDVDVIKHIEEQLDEQIGRNGKFREACSEAMKLIDGAYSILEDALLNENCSECKLLKECNPKKFAVCSLRRFLHLVVSYCFITVDRKYTLAPNHSIAGILKIEDWDVGNQMFL